MSPPPFRLSVHLLSLRQEVQDSSPPVALKFNQSRRFVSPPPCGGGLKTCPPLRKVADLRALRRAAEDPKSASSRIKIQ